MSTCNRGLNLVNHVPMECTDSLVFVSRLVMILSNLMA